MLIYFILLEILLGFGGGLMVHGLIMVVCVRMARRGIQERFQLLCNN